MSNIPVFKPYITQDEINITREALELGWLGSGCYVREFEVKIANLIGVEPDVVVAVNTGTSAVHLALNLCDVNPGDEVITPSFNNIADFQSIRYLGAEPVFCDIKGIDLTIDPDKITELITEKTKAIITLDYGCSLCDYQAVKSIAKKHNLTVIHDACHSFSSKNSSNKMVGSYSDICTFSFDPVKNITCIDGGAVIVKNLAHAEKLRHMRQLGQMQSQKKLYENSRSFSYDVENIGYRYHLANLHAAIGIEQIKKIDFLKEKRQKIYQMYSECFENKKIVFPSYITQNIFPFIYVVRVLENRQGFIDYCQSNGIDTGIHWQPGHQFTYFSNCRSGDLSITNKIAKKIVTLPMYPNLTEQQMMKIIYVVNKFAG